MSLQHVVIVGGSSGIGFATASQLLSLGHKVTITGRSKQRLEAAKTKLDGDLTVLILDAADKAQLSDTFKRIGTFDHLVLALGSDKGAGLFESVSLDSVRQGFEEKFFPHFATAQAALSSLHKDGSITFISAVTAQAAIPGTAGIGAANAAVAALVPILAAELRPLRVNGVSPGVIDTPWWDFLTEEQKASAFADYASRTLVGRVGRPEEVGQAIVFLIDNHFISGEIITCDGGLRFGG